MQQLHLVGFTTDLEGLIFSARKGSKSGSFVVPIDGALVATIEDAQRLRDGEPETTDGGRATLTGRPPRPESTLSPREIQARLRAGSTIAEVAKAAGVDQEWVGRFAAPILAEQSQVIDRARRLTYSKSRLGPSAQPLGTSVLWNLVDRGLRMTERSHDTAWRAWNLHGAIWIVQFEYVSRQRGQAAEWEVDLREGTLHARNRLAADLGYVESGRRRRSTPLFEPPALDPPAASPAGGRSGAPAKSAGVVQTAPARKTGGGTKKTAGAKKTAAKKPGAKKAAARKTAATGRSAARSAAPKKRVGAKKAAAATRGAGRAGAATSAGARSGAGRAAAKSTAAKSTAGKSTATKSLTGKSLAAKSGAARSAAPKSGAKSTAGKSAARTAVGRTGSRRTAASTRRVSAPAKKAVTRKATARKAGANKSAPGAPPPPRAAATEERVSHLARPIVPPTRRGAARDGTPVVPDRAVARTGSGEAGSRRIPHEPMATPPLRETTVRTGERESPRIERVRGRPAAPTAPPPTPARRAPALTSTPTPTSGPGSAGDSARRTQPPQARTGPATGSAPAPRAQDEPQPQPRPRPVVPPPPVAARAARDGQVAIDNGETSVVIRRAPARQASPAPTADAPSEARPDRVARRMGRRDGGNGNGQGSGQGGGNDGGGRRSGGGSDRSSGPASTPAARTKGPAPSPTPTKAPAAAPGTDEQVWHGPGSGDPVPPVRIRADLAAAASARNEDARRTRRSAGRERPLRAR